MAEFSSLNGYAVKDAVARGIAKGRNQALSYTDYATMIEALNAMDNNEFKVGQNIYIGTVGVPDLWVYSVEPIVHNFSYVSDAEVVNMLESNTTIQAGYYRLAMLEGQKVDLTSVNERIDDCFQSVSDGKALIASAITGKKVATDAKATFATMAANIKKIVLGSGNATTADVLSGKTFTNDDGVQYTGTLALSGTASTADVLSGKTFYNTNAKSKSTGTMPNNGAVSKTITPSTSSQSYTIPKGYHSGSGKVTVSAAPTSLINGDATESNVLSGKKFFSDSYTVKTGTMTNNGAKTASLDCGESYTIPSGYHSGSGKITANSLKSQTSASAVAANITSGKTAWVNGVKITGTRPAPVKSLSGSVTFTVAAATSAGSVTTKKIVNFSSAFDSVPTVKVVSTTQQTTITTTATDVTKSSFTINAKNHGMYGSNDIKFEWSAED